MPSHSIRFAFAVVALLGPVSPASQLPQFAMARIEPGTFMMGSNDGDPDERPVHRVRLTKGFEIGQYEVTQAEWVAVMQENPSEFNRCPTCPVERVSWNAARQFLARLNGLQ